MSIKKNAFPSAKNVDAMQDQMIQVKHDFDLIKNMTIWTFTGQCFKSLDVVMREPELVLDRLARKIRHNKGASLRVAAAGLAVWFDITKPKEEETKKVSKFKPVKQSTTDDPAA